MEVLDTHKAVKSLMEAGFTDAQAEALTAVVAQTRAPAPDLSHLATKDDLKQFATKDDLKQLATKDELREAVKLLATKDELRDAIKTLATKDELRAAIAESKTSLIQWMIGTMIALVAITLTIVRLVPGH